MHEKYVISHHIHNHEGKYLKPKVIGIRLQSFAYLQHSLKAKWDTKLILRV